MRPVTGTVVTKGSPHRPRAYTPAARRCGAIADEADPAPRPDGSRTTLLTAADGLASPTATALRGTTPHVTDAGDGTPVTRGCGARGSTPRPASRDRLPT